MAHFLAILMMSLNLSFLSFTAQAQSAETSLDKYMEKGSRAVEGGDPECEVPEACTKELTDRKASLPGIEQNMSCVNRVLAGGITEYKPGCVTNGSVVPAAGSAKGTK